MVGSLLLALTCAVAASATNYGDYSGVNMPQYGGAEYDMGRDPPPSHPSDDYHGHSPDAPASPDYKYEEEPRIKTDKPLKERDDSDRWRKSGRKHSEMVRSTESDTNSRNKYDLIEDDEIPKFRTNRRYSKHRSRLKNEIDERIEDTPVLRRLNKYSRDRKDISDIDRKDYFIDKEYIPDDKNKEFEGDVKFVSDLTTKRVVRRRPRDKPPKRQTATFDDYDDEPPADRKIKGESEKDAQIPFEVSRQRPPDLRKAPGHQIYQPPAEEEENESRDDALKVIPGRFKLKGYNEYDDYYDMKRVNNIKNRLPSLLRRTTVSTETKTNRNLLDVLMPNRRMMASKVEADRTTEVSRSTVTQTVLINKDSSTTTLKPVPKVPSQEISLAEKSRLSILKKAQRKEGQSFRSTKKPPVLLQVTSQMPTVVMVEPPSSTVAWMRAREEEDTPARIEMVKRLMRQKLVKEAKSIHDLTDNWDDMVCDYIDLSLLEGASSAALPLVPANYLLIFCLPLYYVCDKFAS